MSVSYSCEIKQLKGPLRVRRSNLPARHVGKHTCFMNGLLCLKCELPIFGVVTLRRGLGWGEEKALAIRNSSNNSRLSITGRGVVHLYHYETRLTRRPEAGNDAGFLSSITGCLTDKRCPD